MLILSYSHFTVHDRDERNGFYHAECLPEVYMDIPCSFCHFHGNTGDFNSWPSIEITTHSAGPRHYWQHDVLNAFN